MKHPRRPNDGPHEPEQGDDTHPTLTPAPARARPPVIERVLHIQRLMVAGQWRPQMAYELAEEWGINRHLVRHYADEASRWLKTAIDQDAARARVAEILDEAIEMARAEPGAKASSALIKAAAEYAKLTGAYAPQKMQVETPALPFGFTTDEPEDAKDNLQ